MYKKEQKINKKISNVYIINIVIVTIVLMVGWYVNSWYPLGESTFIFRDLEDQYLGFYEHFNNVIRGRESFMYSMNKGIGGSMYNLWTYYLMSPFNFIYLLFNGDNLISGVLIVYALKVVAMTITSTYYFKQKNITQILNTVLTMGWVFSGYVIQYRIHLMWLDSLILLPLLILELEKGLTKGKYGRYTVLLTLTILSNYYMGYIVGVFTILYTLYIYLIKEKEENIYIWGYVRHCLYSGMMSLVVLIPTALEVYSGNGQGRTSFNLLNTFRWDSVLANIRFIDITQEGFSRGAPLLSIGTVATILLINTFKRSEPKHKKAYLIIFTIYLLSYIINPISLIWTLGRAETGNLYRYSITFVWFTLMFIANSESVLKEYILDTKERFVIILILIITSVPLILSQQALLVIVGLVVTLMSILNSASLFVKTSVRKKIMVVLVVFEAITITIYTGTYISTLNAVDYKKQSIETKQTLSEVEKLPYYKKRTYSLVKELNKANQGFTHMTPLTSHSSSGIEKTTDSLYRGLGVAAEYAYTGLGMVDITQSLLGINYVIKDKDLPEQVVFIEQDYFKEVSSNLYENTIRMPFAYTIETLIPQYDGNSNYYYNQVTQSLFKQEYIHPHKIEVKDSYNMNIKGDRYEVKDLSKAAWLTYSEQNEDIYMTSKFLYTTDYIDNDVGFYNSTHLQCVGCNKGDIKLSVYSPQLYNSVGNKGSLPKFYKVNKKQMLKDIESYTQTHTTMRQTEDSTHTKIVGNINNQYKDKYLQVSIPYDKGWTAYVDGKEVDIEESMHFLAIPIPEGVSEIELTYFTPYLKESIVLSLIGLTLFGMDISITNRRRKEE